MWLGNAQSYESQGYWVEAGIRAIVTPNANKASLFWADFRPNGLGFAAHYSNPLTNNDHGKNAVVVIQHLPQTVAGTWDVTVTGLPDTSLTGTSTYNDFSGEEIDIGMEICGTLNASAPRNDFSQNKWVNGGNFNYQTQYVNLNPQQSTARGYWTQNPNSSNGGVWSTCVSGNVC